ncbi:MAG TPA: 1-deoxy-D-xylulose-5-phosphate reductoisomerase, partial [Aeromicrobium sp.]|nr:1-deoxy-D-xylulose-5-phosphate reductoisomerase [Aeromicrobium sp.]
ATSGTVGFRPTIDALAAGKPVALANKETLIMAGHLVTEAAALSGAPLLPIDSEHSAIWQCLQGEQPYAERVRRLLLTASGGAFRERQASTLGDVTPEEALKHPTWSMGPKITIDSATLMNKGLEVIEAYWLFGVPADRIDVLVHPQSVVHSMVAMVDGSVIAQLGVTDMRLPIQYAFSYPDRWTAPMPPLDLTRCGALEFAAPDTDRFPCLDLAFRALTGDAGLPVVLNAANEVAVAAFLEARLPFTAIPEVITGAMDAHERNGTSRIRHLDDVRVIDRWAREFAGQSAAGLQ